MRSKFQNRTIVFSTMFPWFYQYTSTSQKSKRILLKLCYNYSKTCFVPVGLFSSLQYCPPLYLYILDNLLSLHPLIFWQACIVTETLCSPLQLHHLTFTIWLKAQDDLHAKFVLIYINHCKTTDIHIWDGPNKHFQLMKIYLSNHLYVVNVSDWQMNVKENVHCSMICLKNVLMNIIPVQFSFFPLAEPCCPASHLAYIQLVYPGLQSNF